MITIKWVAGLAAALVVNSIVLAGSLSINKSLPVVKIEKLGELVYENENYSYRPWNTRSATGEVYVLQYFPGTMAASKIFEPFTDRLISELSDQNVHVTTIINLNEAMWGTTGFVISKVKTSKRKFPESTMVLDEKGLGERAWDLGEKGAVLLLIGSDGDILSLFRKQLSEQEISSTLSLIVRISDG